MKKVRHWLHVVMIILTCGLWLPGYLMILATAEMHNRGYRAGKAAGRVERQNEIDEERAKPKTIWSSMPDQRTLNCRSVMVPIECKPAKATRINRFAELAERVRTVGLTESERTEYHVLRKELMQ